MVGKKNELDARGCQKNFQEIHLALVTNVFLRRETDIKEKEEEEEKQAFWVNGKFYGKIVARS